ncbi:MAG: 30S ribosomal protein S2 [Ignavibacteriaceae bacterium]
MKKLELTQLIEAGAHFGHLTRRWNPKMKEYIFMEKNGIHIIDLKKTQTRVNEAAENLMNLVAEGKRVLFVGTKKQAKNVIDGEARRCDANWVSERWLGGMLTNFSTIRKSIKRLNMIEKQETDGTFEKITKKERLFLTREKDKLKKVLEGVESMNRIPGAMFVVDIKKESIAIKEAHRLNIPVFAIVDTNCDPDDVDYVIPANDDAVKTIELITAYMADAVAQGGMVAQEKKAEEAAAAERIAKEREASEKTETPSENEQVKTKKRLKKTLKKEEADKTENVATAETKKTEEVKAEVAEKPEPAKTETTEKPVATKTETTENKETEKE